MTRLKKSTRLAIEQMGLAFEIAIFEATLDADPGALPALEGLAHAYTRSGRARDALTIDRRLVAALPENPLAHYNLACSLALTGAEEPALDALERAVALGFRDVKRLRKDPDLAPLRESARFQMLVGR